MRERRVFARVAALAVLTVVGTTFVAACSLIVDPAEPQCRTTSDCTARGGTFASTTCQQSVCVTSSPLDAGLDGASDAAADAHAVADADGAGAPYACVGHHPSPVPTTTSIKVSLTFSDFLTSLPLTDVTVRACPNATDPSCVLPEALEIPDKNGTVTFTLDTTHGAFTGYFKVDPGASTTGGSDASTGDASGGAVDGDTADGAPVDAHAEAAHDGPPPDATTPDASVADVSVADASGQDATPTDAGIGANTLPSRIFYSDDPIATDFSDTWTLIDTSTVSVLVSTFGLAPPDPSLGVALLTVLDCNNNEAAGVTVSLDALSTKAGSVTEGFYELSGAPSGSATQTDSSGIVGFINAPIGNRVFTAQLAGTQTVVGTLSAYVYPGAVTYGNLAPSFTSP